MNNNDCEECKKLRNLLHRERHFSNELHNKININQASHTQLNNEIFELKAQIKKMERANNILNKIIYDFCDVYVDEYIDDEKQESYMFIRLRGGRHMCKDNELGYTHQIDIIKDKIIQHYEKMHNENNN